MTRERDEARHSVAHLQEGLHRANLAVAAATTNHAALEVCVCACAALEV